METIDGGTLAQNKISDEIQNNTQSDIHVQAPGNVQTNLQNLGSFSLFAEKHPDLYREMVEHGVPLNPQEVKAQGYRFYKDNNGTERVLYPSPEYQTWLQSDELDLTQQPHEDHHETWEEKAEREDIVAEITDYRRFQPGDFWGPQSRGYFAKHIYLFTDKADDFLQNSSEYIRDNLAHYYIEGQKDWLASKYIPRQTGQAEPITNGIIAESIAPDTPMAKYIGDASYCDIRQYLSGRLDSYSKNDYTLRTYNLVHDKVIREVNKIMGGRVINNESIHHLKYQALEEFIEEGRNFAENGWASRDDLVMDENGAPVRSTGRNFLEREGFVNTEGEWQKLRSLAYGKTISKYGIDDFYENADGQIEYQLDSSKVSTYDQIFNLEEPPISEVLAKTDYINSHLKQLYTQFITDDAERPYFVDLAQTGDWRTSKRITEEARQQDFESEINQFHALLDKATEQAPPEQAKLIQQKFQTAMGEIPQTKEERPLDEINQLANALHNAFCSGSVWSKEGKVTFVQPRKLIQQNHDYLVDLDKHIFSSSYRAHLTEGEALLIESLVNQSFHFGFSYSQQEKALSNILEATKNPEVSNNDSLLSEAMLSIKDYFTFWGDRQIEKWLKTAIPQQADSPKTQELLIELQRQKKITDAVRMISSGRDLYNFSSKDLDENLQNFQQATENLSEETAETREQYLRQISYDGLFEIFMAPLSREQFGGAYYGIEAKENSANRYFEAFNYAEHMDELNDFITSKIIEMRNSGNKKDASLFLRRYRHWTRNDSVRSAFENYLEQVAEKERREAAENSTEIAEQDGVQVKIYYDTSAKEVKDYIKKFLEEKEKQGMRFDYRKGHGKKHKGEGDPLIIPGKVALERINALEEWSKFIKTNLHNADVEEAAMVFHPQYGTLKESLNHLDGNVYSAVAFNFAGKRCMIAECAGVNEVSTKYGAMKIWCGDINDRDGWKRAFDKHTKTEATNLNLCKSVSHYNLTKDVMRREDDDLNHIIDAEDWLFKLAFHYFETGDESILSNNLENRRRLEEMIGPQFWRTNTA